MNSINAIAQIRVDQLMLAHQNRFLAIHMARKWAIQTRRPIDTYELIAMEALERAASSYDAERGVSFGAFAALFIRNDILTEMKRAGTEARRMADHRAEARRRSRSRHDEAQASIEQRELVGQIHAVMTLPEREIAQLIAAGREPLEIARLTGKPVTLIASRMRRLRLRMAEIFPDIARPRATRRKRGSALQASLLLNAPPDEGSAGPFPPRRAASRLSQVPTPDLHHSRCRSAVSGSPSRRRRERDQQSSDQSIPSRSVHPGSSRRNPHTH